MKVSVLHYQVGTEPVVVEQAIITPTMGAFRALLESWGCRKFGRKGRDFRIVPDQNAFGLKVKGLGVWDGEAIVLKWRESI